eukprot:CAMPEP_0178403634 /NCGR_PEP_ID=MMETSP0689_2-20121128/17471_1 /TAXON_ID=160604 /ORGANISM="Amphidinium massartii, Strain CS-259" /LENGTH=551 /DNA_ID=CAMNT_0020024597 /DNA_START=128 /DNA_END=1783 /DNA_ORIENTATION=-
MANEAHGANTQKGTELQLPVPGRCTLGAAINQQSASSFLLLQDIEKVDPDSILLELVKETFAYYREWKEAYDSWENENFWHKFSNKTVLAVGAIEKEDGTLTLARGINTEVCNHDGSFCAERAVIVRLHSELALAGNLRFIAVFDPAGDLNPLAPCQVCQSWILQWQSCFRGQYVNIVTFKAGTEVDGSKPVEVQVRHLVKTGDWRYLGLKDLVPCAFPVTEEHEVICSPCGEWPPEGENASVVYVDGAFMTMHPGQQHILSEAKKLGSHLLVGIHSDDTLQQLECHVLTSYEHREQQVLSNRHVSAVLRHASWNVSLEMLEKHGVDRVVTGTFSKQEDLGLQDPEKIDPYSIPRERGILTEIQSLDNTTEARKWPVAELRGDGICRRTHEALMEYCQLFQEKCAKMGTSHLTFAHKRTKKPLLAVGAIEMDDGSLQFVQALNSEVSLPGGTVGAVRSVLQQVQSQLIDESALRVIALVDPNDEENPVQLSKVCEHALLKWAEQGASVAIMSVLQGMKDVSLRRLLASEEWRPCSPEDVDEGLDGLSDASG